MAQKIIAGSDRAVYLDLERRADLNKLRDPEAFFDLNADKLICLDEIQRTLWLRGGFPRSFLADNEIDLILEKGRQRLAVEVKASTSPEVKRSFWNALKDLQIDKAWIVAPVETAYPYKQGIQVVSPHMLDLN